MNYDEFRKEGKRRQEVSILLMKAKLKLNASLVREQQAADEEGCGALLCAIREARKEIARGRG